MIRTTILAAGIVLMCGCRVREAFTGVRAPVLVGQTAEGADPAALSRLAVLVDAPSGYDVNHAGLIAAEFEQVLIANGHRVVARHDLERVVGELEFQQTGWTDRQGAQFGHIANVPAVLIVRLDECIVVERAPGSWDGTVALTAKLVGVERADVQWVCAYRGEHYVDAPELVGSVLAPIARGVAAAFPRRR